MSATTVGALAKNFSDEPGVDRQERRGRSRDRSDMPEGYRAHRNAPVGPAGDPTASFRGIVCRCDPGFRFLLGLVTVRERDAKGKQGRAVAREHRVTASSTVAAPLEAVWDLVCEMDRYDEWIESTIELLCTDGRAAQGASFEERSRVSGLFTATLRWTVREVEPLARIAFDGEGVSVIRGLGFAIDVCALGESTEFALTLWYTPRFGPVGSLVDWLTRSNVTNDQKRSVRTFAVLAEGPSGEPVAL